VHPGLSKDTQLCISLSGRPSNIGTRFHNHLYAALGLDYVYKAFTTTDLAGAVTGIRALGIRGAGVSMPFKEDVIALVDALEPSAEAIRSVNTIVNTDGRLVASNTDYLAVEGLLRTHGVAPATTTATAGTSAGASTAARPIPAAPSTGTPTKAATHGHASRRSGERPPGAGRGSGSGPVAALTPR
jgi:shikimate dehydrogenase